MHICHTFAAHLITLLLHICCTIAAHLFTLLLHICCATGMFSLLLVCVAFYSNTYKVHSNLIDTVQFGGFSPLYSLVAVIKIISLLLGQQTRIEANQRCSALLSGTSLSCVPPCHFSLSLVTFAFHLSLFFSCHFSLSLVTFLCHL